MKKENNQNVIIGVLGTLVLVVAILVVLSMTGTISFAKNDCNTNSNEEIVENNNENIFEEAKDESIDKKEPKTNKTIEKYLGGWVLGFNNTTVEYTNINIKKSTASKTGYAVDVFINKEANYKDLELYCGENAGVCYATGDENHHFGIVMANEMIVVIPDYSVQGTIWECGTRK